MKTRFLLFLSIILFCSSFTYSQTPVKDSVFQSWNEVQLILPVVTRKDAKGKNFDRATASFNGVLRIGRKNLDFLDNRIGVTIDFRVNKYVSMVTGALYRKDELAVNRRNFETRFNIGAVFSKTWRGFTFRDRNMYEHRFRNSRSDTNLYRQRFQVSYPIKREKKDFFAPFISEEGYYDLRLCKWVQNEFFVGVTRKINPKTSIDLAYIHSDNQLVNVNGVSINLKIRLR